VRPALDEPLRLYAPALAVIAVPLSVKVNVLVELGKPVTETLSSVVATPATTWSIDSTPLMSANWI